MAFAFKHKDALSGEESWALCVLLLAFYGDLYFLLSIVEPDYAPWISAGFSVVVLGLYQITSQVLRRTPNTYAVPVMLPG